MSGMTLVFPSQLSRPNCTELGLEHLLPRIEISQTKNNCYVLMSCEATHCPFLTKRTTYTKYPFINQKKRIYSRKNGNHEDSRCVWSRLNSANIFKGPAWLMSTNTPLIEVNLMHQPIGQGQHSTSWKAMEKLLDKGLGYRKEWKTEANTPHLRSQCRFTDSRNHLSFPIILHLLHFILKMSSQVYELHGFWEREEQCLTLRARSDAHSSALVLPGAGLALTAKPWSIPVEHK